MSLRLAPLTTRTLPATILVGALAMSNILAASAAGSPPEPSSRVNLGGHVPGWAQAGADLGAVAPDLELRQLTLVLKRPPTRQQAFDALLEELHDPASPNYQRWLTPSEIGRRFGASDAAIATASAWLQAQGLDVEGVDRSRLRLRFRGRAAALETAFATPLHHYATKSGPRMATPAPPSVPAALSDLVAGVVGLNSLRFQSNARAHLASSDELASPTPEASICDGAGPCTYTLFPADVATIYNLGPLADLGLDGRGQTIGIIARSNVSNADVRVFQERSGLALKDPVVEIPTDGVDPGPAATACENEDCEDPSEAVLDQMEATLDVQRAGSVAPGAKVKLITSGTVDNVDGVWIALDHAIDAEPVPAQIISLSYGLCEEVAGSGFTAILDDAFAQAAMQGISIFVSSGDGGVAGCAPAFGTPGPEEPISTNVLCSSGHAICVGGTQYNYRSDPNRFWNRSNDANYGSARSYIPEGAWNEPLGADGSTRMAATGGGVSRWIPTPAWQKGVGVPGRQGRYTPDLSLSASTQNGYFTCLAAMGGSCVRGADQRFNFMMMGGTSASAPTMAGIAALLNQHVGHPQANLNPRLYRLAADPANGVFHDVTVASSGVAACDPDLPSLCNNASPGPNGPRGGRRGFIVGTGYDLATGLGSIDATRLVTQWQATAPTRTNPDQHGLGGAWSNPATDGQGFVIEVYPDLFGKDAGLLFGGWFTYGHRTADGQRWFTVQGQVRADSHSAALPIYESSGGRFVSPQPATLREVGQAIIAFEDCSHAQLAYEFHDGTARSGSIPLTHLLPNPHCSPAGDNGQPAGANLWGGTWADPANDQQGLVLDIDPTRNVFFGAWYTFTSSGAPSADARTQRWYTLQGVLPPAGGHRFEDIGIYATTGGRFDHGAATTTTRVGSARLSFTSCTAAQLDYNFSAGDHQGRSGSLALQRPGPAPKGCSL